MTSVADRASSQNHDRYLTRMSAYLRAMFPVGTRVLTAVALYLGFGGLHEAHPRGPHLGPLVAHAPGSLEHLRNPADPAVDGRAEGPGNRPGAVPRIGLFPQGWSVCPTSA